MHSDYIQWLPRTTYNYQWLPMITNDFIMATFSLNYEYVMTKFWLRSGYILAIIWLYSGLILTTFTTFWHHSDCILTGRMQTMIIDSVTPLYRRLRATLNFGWQAPEGILEPGQPPSSADWEIPFVFIRWRKLLPHSLTCLIPNISRVFRHFDWNCISPHHIYLSRSSTLWVRLNHLR